LKEAETLAKYLLKRIGQSILTLVIILTLVFIMVRQMPIDGYFENIDKLDEAVIKATLDQMGLNDPILVQLKDFFVNLLHGDLGTSARYSRGVPITQIIAAKAPISIQMGLLSMAVSMLLGIPLGAAMARSKNKFWDKFGTVFIVLVNAVPAAVYYIYLQSYGSLALNVSMLFEESNWVSWILPVFSMSLGNIAYYAMWLRRYMLDEMNKDYVRLARAKGVNSKKITMRHVFRNAFVPMIQYIPTSLLYTVSGSIYIESLYSIPGMGGLLVDVISKQDNPMVQALVMIYSCIGIVGMILGDILMTIIDPRISLNRKEGAR
jgi:ABC-type dipeptide/oligopeptide/nickel transport system permease component